MNNSIGIYLHVPFCVSKCAYCDFYSARADEATKEAYKAALCRDLSEAGARLSLKADTLYFGGGTPTLLGGRYISEIISAAKKAFGLEITEITVEANPSENLAADLRIMADAGVNRLSLGVQSAVPEELKALSRRHSVNDVVRTVKDARAAGIDNISVDLMLGIPHETAESLEYSLNFLMSLEPTHVSCYILKIEPDTPFGKADEKNLGLPSEDTVADMYMFTSEYLQSRGYEHYEISNFAKPGYRSRHNMKYWQCDEYLGLGPAAHSFIGGKRFYYPRDTEKFILSPAAVEDGTGGDEEEYIMLRLRLKDGLDFGEYEKRFGKYPENSVISSAKRLQSAGLAEVTENRIALTVKGFLLSNTCITELLYAMHQKKE